MKNKNSHSHPLTKAKRKAEARFINRGLHKARGYVRRDYDGHDAWRIDA